MVTRIRPSLKSESGDDAVSKVNDCTLRYDAPSSVGTAGPKHFESNLCVDGTVNNKELFDLCNIKSLLDSALDGYR